MPEQSRIHLNCVVCGKEYPWSFSVQCPDCNDALVDIDYDVSKARIGKDGPMIERYFDLLPITRRENIIDGGEGNTPTVHEIGRASWWGTVYISVVAG